MIKILVAEDDKATNDLVCAYLRANDYQTTACTDGEQALLAFEKNSFDMLITDIMIPNTDGFALAEAVRAIRTINLADGAVSILALQTALLFTFRSGDVDVSLFNTFTGAAVSLLTLALGVFMIVEAQKKIKQIQRENIQ